MGGGGGGGDGGKKHGREYRWLCVCVLTRHAGFGVKDFGVGARPSNN